MENYELSPETAHSKARILLKDDFYWSQIEESGPFGNDDGSDAFYGFLEWRSLNKKETPITFLKELLVEWGFPPFDWQTLDTTIIRRYISGNSNSQSSLQQDQIKVMKQQFQEMAEKEGKVFDEAIFNQMLSETTGDIGGRYLLAIDNAIIAVGFGQLVLEGKIDTDLKKLTQIALQREMIPVLIGRWGDYKATRNEILNKMILTIDNIED